MKTKIDVLDRLKQALVELDLVGLDELVKEALSFKLNSMKVLDVLRSGMEEIGQRFEANISFRSLLWQGSS